MFAKNALLNSSLYFRHLANTARYLSCYGRLPNYVEPVLYSEKVQWRKLFDRNPLFPVFVDKLAVRSYVKKRAPAVTYPKILWAGFDPKAIRYADLPDKFVLKPSHRSGDILFVHDRAHLNSAFVAETCRRWMNSRYGRSKREWAYQNLVGQLIVEEMLDTNPDSGRSRDYRFHVFDGSVQVVIVNFAVFKGMTRSVTGSEFIFDRDWNRLPYRRIHEEMVKLPQPPRPERLDEMVLAAESLGKGIDYIRVDFYVVGEEIYFGEITIYPSSGFATFSHDPALAYPIIEPFDVFMGHKWTMLGATSS